MDGDELTGPFLLALILGAGLLSFGLAALGGGAVASLAVRRGPPAGLAVWSLVAIALAGAVTRIALPPRLAPPDPSGAG